MGKTVFRWGIRFLKSSHQEINANRIAVEGNAIKFFTEDDLVAVLNVQAIEGVCEMGPLIDPDKEREAESVAEEAGMK